MNALAARITAVNDIAEQLLKANPPGKDSIVNTQKQLNHRWGEKARSRQAGSRKGVGRDEMEAKDRLKTRRESHLEYVQGKGAGDERDGNGLKVAWGFPGSSVVKNSPANAGDAGSIPGSGRSPGEGNGNPLWYSCLGSPMGWGAWQAIQSIASQRARHDSD